MYTFHNISLTKSIVFNGILHFLERYWNFVCTPKMHYVLIFDLVIYLPTYQLVHMTEVARLSHMYTTFNLMQTAFVLYTHFKMCLCFVCRVSITWRTWVHNVRIKCHGGECNPIAWWCIMHYIYVHCLVAFYFLLRKVRERHVQLHIQKNIRDTTPTI